MPSSPRARPPARRPATGAAPAVAAPPGRWPPRTGPFAFRVILALGFLFLLAATARADDDVWWLEQQAAKAARKLEVKPQAEPPPWARQEPEPIVRFAQLSDIHHGDDTNFLRAREFLNTAIRPDWVVVTGDNLAPPYDAGHQQHMKDLLGGLTCPFYVIKGDNDARDFEQVFGSSRWCFDCGGLHFVAAALDYDAEGAGIGGLDRSSYRWLEADLAAHAGQPTIFFFHENVVPPDFLGAAHLGVVLAHPRSVVATLSGHLHDDLEYRLGETTHIACPALGPHERHGFKVYAVHEDHITVKTYEVEGDAYVFAHKWQRIGFPRHLRADPTQGNAVTGYAAAEPRPTRFDPTLTRFSERAQGFLKRLSRLLQSARKQPDDPQPR